MPISEYISKLQSLEEYAFSRAEPLNNCNKPEPSPFAEKPIAEIQALLPDARVVLVDGEAFSWYGTRELKVGRYYEELWDRIVAIWQKSKE